MDALFKALTYTFEDPFAPRDALTERILAHLYPMELQPSQSQPHTSDFGHLHRLPTELLFEILGQLSMPALVSVRNSNRYARYIVDSIPAFRSILRFAPHTIRGLLAIDTSVHIDLSLLYRKLRQRNCDHCEIPSQHLWLPTAARLCHLCIHRIPMPLLEDEVLSRFNLHKNDLALLPSFRFIPSTFANADGKIRVGRRHVLYDAAAAAEIAFERSGKRIRSYGLYQEQEEARRKLVRLEDARGVIVEFDFPPRQLRWAMANALVPWVSLVDAEYGAWCSTCMYTKMQDVPYGKVEFLEHLKVCRVQPWDLYETFPRKFWCMSHILKIVV